MPNFTPSNLALAQAKLIGAFATSDLRFRDPKVFKLFLKNLDSNFGTLKYDRTREDRPTSAYFGKASTRILAGGRQHNHTGVKGDSQVLTPSFVIRNDTFAYSLKQADNNVFSAQEMMDLEIQNVVRNMANGLDSVAVNKIFSTRSGVNLASSNGVFNAIQKVYEINATLNQNFALTIMQVVMDVNSYGGKMDIVCDPAAYTIFLTQAAQGATNATNLSFQFLGIEFIMSPELKTLAGTLGGLYTKGFWVAVPEGTIGAIAWLPKQNMLGVETQVNTYGTLINPVDGLTYATHMYQTRADESGLNGQTQDVRTEVQISIDLALEVAPVTVALETPLFAFGLV
jgi:hypothetical protein